MRLLPYSNALIDRRAAGERPWLTLVTMGNDVERSLMRMGAFHADRELARIWVPDDFNIGHADLGWAVGLDVFVAGFCAGERLTEFLVLLWAARPATLWVLDGTTEQDRGGRWRTNMSKFTGTQVALFPPYRVPMDFAASFRHEVPLNNTFKEVVARAREVALLLADGPLFNDARFAESRAKLLAA